EISCRLASVSVPGANWATATAYGASSAFMSSAYARAGTRPRRGRAPRPSLHRRVGARRRGAIIVRHRSPDPSRCPMTPSPRPSPPPGTRCALALAALAVATGLGACSPDAAAGPPETPTASGTPSAAASEETTPGPQASASPTPEPDGLAAELAAAVSSGDTAPIEALLSEPTRVVIAASEADVSYSAVDAVLALDYIQPGVGVWDFELAPTVVAGYAA